ncbi:MAG: U32 family peptidase C-terminal domain-containing protein, partial [Eubacterium sp.]|nr:U32 family peptidase C-terminal domain-containing protein [Eubacterium sp.]
HAYRQALDAYLANPESYRFDESWMDELLKASHREFTTGFFFGPTGAVDQNYETSRYIKEYSFVGKVTGYDEKTRMASVEQRNKMITGDTAEVFGPDISYFEQEIKLFDGDSGEPLGQAPHPQQKLLIPMDRPVKPGYLIRKKI